MTEMGIRSLTNKNYRWWQLKHFLELSPLTLEKMIQFDDHIFSNGLVQPPTRKRGQNSLDVFFSLVIFY